MKKHILIIAIILSCTLLIIGCDIEEDNTNKSDSTLPEDISRKQIPPPLPFPEEKPIVTQEIVNETFVIVYSSSFAQDTTESDVGHKWQLKLQNLKLKPIYLKARLRWHNEGGDILHEVINRRLKLQPQEIKDFTGIERIVTYDPSEVKAFRAEVTVDLSEL